jgi:hypothetical protein
MNVATGVPLFEPTVWSIRTARNAGLAFATIEAKAPVGREAAVFIYMKTAGLGTASRGFPAFGIHWRRTSANVKYSMKSNENQVMPRAPLENSVGRKPPRGE